MVEPIILRKRCRYGDMLYIKDDFYIGNALHRYGEFSELEAVLFADIVKPGQIVLEAGANIGAHSVRLAQLVGPQGIVFAFEPQQIIYSLLCANAKVNGLANIQPVQSGLGARQETLRLPAIDYSQSVNFGGISLTPEGLGQEVPVTTVDSLDLPALHFLKVDVEGMETDVLEGARQTIQRHKPVLYVENDREDKSPQLITLIDGLGYDMWWHMPLLFNPGNVAGETENIYPGVMSVNLLCLPGGAGVNMVDFRKVTGPDDSWKK